MMQDYAEAVAAARDLVVYSIKIGDTRYVFPIGTTRAEAQSVLDEARDRYLVHLSKRNPA